MVSGASSFRQAWLSVAATLCSTRAFARVLWPPARGKLGLGLDPRDWGSAEGPRLTAANGQPSGAPLGGDSPQHRLPVPRSSNRAKPTAFTQGVWFEGPRGRIALLLPAAAGVPVSWESNATARGVDKWLIAHRLVAARSGQMQSQ